MVVKFLLTFVFVLIAIYARKDGEIMNTMKQLVQDYEYITPKMAEKSGISKFKFNKYVHENGLEQVSHGIYTSDEQWVDELYVLHQRSPKAVFSHDEAFYTII